MTKKIKEKISTWMSKEKQLEEMDKDIGEAIMHNSVVDIINGGFIGVNSEGMARELYEEGYCKRSEVAKEIFEDIEKNCRAFGVYGVHGYLMNDIAELKKKYTEGE